MIDTNKYKIVDLVDIDFMIQIDSFRLGSSETSG